MMSMNREGNFDRDGTSARADGVAAMPDHPTDARTDGRSEDVENEGGIVTALAELPEGSLIYESDLARILGKHRRTIQRAVDRGELPPPVRFMGGPMWTAGAILRHIESLLERAKTEREKFGRRVRKFAAGG